MNADDVDKTETWPCRPCPVPDCEARFLTADGAGRHLDRVHGEAKRWAGGRIMACDEVGPEGNSLIIADMSEGSEEAWLQSDVYMEVKNE